MRFEEVSASFTPVKSPPGSASLGSFHRCSFTGPADHLEDWLTPSQLLEEDSYYFGRDRRRHYFQHLFVERECTNGLPKGHCLSALHAGEHCGQDQDWSVLAPHEKDGPGIMWRNEQPCVYSERNDEKNATVVVDYFCPTDEEDVHLHLCTFEGEPERVSGGTLDALLSNSNGMNPDPQGYFQHVFSNDDCMNGLPARESNGKWPRCVASVRWMEHCGDEHDWRVFAPGENKELDGAPALRWFTSHSCGKARVAVDFFCAKGPSGLEFPRRLHRCTFQGRSRAQADQALCKKVNRLAPPDADGRGGAPLGACMEHTFSADECTNGLPRGECVAARHAFSECGQEQDLRLLDPVDLLPERQRGDARRRASATGAKAQWYNAMDGGPCGEASLVVDYYCHAQCVRRCKNGGALRQPGCTCDCRAVDPLSLYTGPECEVCGGTPMDCPSGFAFDEKACTCRQAGVV